MMAMFLNYVKQAFPLIFCNAELHTGTLDLKVVQVLDFINGRSNKNEGITRYGYLMV
jgi:hypothetical protein